MQVEQVTTEQPVEQIIADTPESALSITDHAKQFGPQAERDEDEPVDPLKPIRPVDQQKREQGKFAEGKTRLKASDAVKRINELTSRAKTAEEKLTSAERELATLRAQGGSKTEIKQAEQKVERAEAKVEATTFNEPEPTEDDPKFENDYAKYLRAAAAWEGRKAYHDEKASERAAQEQAQKDASERESIKSWAGRVETAKAKHADFDAVAFGPTRIVEGSPIDAFIMEDELGPDVLYHLNQHPEIVDRLQGLPAVKQLRELVAIAMELSPPVSVAGSTSAAPARTDIKHPPKPPTLVRTEAQAAKDAPPPTDGSLSLAEHRKHFGPKAR